jgi:hypothetical protein
MAMYNAFSRYCRDRINLNNRNTSTSIIPVLDIVNKNAGSKIREVHPNQNVDTSRLKPINTAR